MLFIQKIFRKKGEMFMSIAVTGATGQLGGLVIQHLLKKSSRQSNHCHRA